jgi:hypothetical protein
MAKSTPNKLTDRLRAQVVAKVTAGESLEACAVWLKAKHGVEITPSCLSRTVKGHRSDLADAAKTKARKATISSVEDAMKSLLARHTASTQIIAKAEAAAKRDPISGMAAYAQAARAYVSIHQEMSKAQGLDQPDDPWIGGLAELLGLAIGEREAEAKAAVAALAQDSK